MKKLAAVAVAIGVSASWFAQVTFGIKPGRSIGDTGLGESHKSVRERMGRPQRNFLAHGRTVEVWEDRSDGTEMEVVFHGGAVVQVKVSDRAYKDARGIRAGSTLATIWSSYPRLKRTVYLYNEKDAKGLEYLDDVKRGICFVFKSPDSNPPRERKAWAVIVHGRDVPALPTEIKDLKNVATAHTRKK